MPTTLRAVTIAGTPKLLKNSSGNLVIQTGSDPPCCNQAPVITSTPGITGTECVLYEYTPSYTDAEGDTVEWSLGGSPPAGMSINPTTGKISWTPDSTQAGTHSITLRVGDFCHPSSAASGSASQTYNLEITDDNCCENDPPVIDSTPVTSGTEGVLYEYQVTATDPESDTLTWCLTVWPDGMTIDSDGLISWTPACDQAGTHNVTVQVGDACHTCEDGTGDQVQSFQVEVADDPNCV